MQENNKKDTEQCTLHGIKQRINDRITKLKQGKYDYDNPNGHSFTKQAHNYWQTTYYDLIEELNSMLEYVA